jgi:hypothetical protein
VSTPRAIASTALCAAALLGAPLPARADMICVTVTVTSGLVSRTTGPFCSADLPIPSQHYHVVNLGPEPVAGTVVTVELVAPA